MPLEFAIAEPADRFCLTIPEIGDEADFRYCGGSPLGTHNAFERSEEATEIGQLALGESLSAKHQHRVMSPQLAELLGYIVQRLPQSQSQYFASKAVVQ